MCIWAFLLLGLMGLPWHAWATDHMAASCSAADIQAKMDIAAQDDRVIVPAGATNIGGGRFGCIWGPSHSITFPNTGIQVIGTGTLVAQGSSGDVNISLQTGAGINAVTIVAPSSAAHPNRLTNIFFQQDTTVPPSVAADRAIAMSAGTVADNLTIDISLDTYHNGFRGSNGFVISKTIVIGPALTVGNNFSTQSAFARWQQGSAEDAWATVSTLGALDTTGIGTSYIEDSKFVNLMQGTDIGDAARGVVRFSTFEQSAITGHGFDSDITGVRQAEFYNNTFKCLENANMTAWIAVRGGQDLVFDNTIPLNSTQCSIGGGTTGNTLIPTYFLGIGPDCYQGTYPYYHQVGWGWVTGATLGGGYDHRSPGSPDTRGQDLEPVYIWHNLDTDGTTPNDVVNQANQQGWAGSAVCDGSHPQQAWSVFQQENRDYYMGKGASFNGTASPGGIGRGTRASRPSSTVNGLAYWSTDQGGNWHTTNLSDNDGCLDKVVGGAWVNCWYTPYTYPHPLVTGGAAPPTGTVPVLLRFLR